MDYIAQIKAHVEAYAQGAEQSVSEHLHAFVAWIEGKQAEEAKEQEAVAFLQGLGYSVTKG